MKKQLTNEYHIPALLSESINGLNIDPDGIYVDVTYGGGGHSRSILNKLKNGRLIAFDKDIDADQNSMKDERFTFVHHDFIFIKNFLQYLKAIPINGIIADLGVSFHQFDAKERGFSHRFEAELDMRMDRHIQLTAKKVINEFSEAELQKILLRFGEIKNSKQLAGKIVEIREKTPIETTNQLTEIVKHCAKPDVNFNKYLGLVYQALRITVNDELYALRKLLDHSKEVLVEGGRMVIITYHSLEDRIVKNFFKTGDFEGKAEKDIYGNIEKPFEVVNKKPITPSPQEKMANPRCRSAKLRIAEKI